MKIGLSLSFCVKDIQKGLVREDEVQFIISGTAVEDYQFEECVEHYCESYWIMDPEGHSRIARRLWEQKKIHQPKLDHGEECEKYFSMPSWHRELVGQGIHWLTVDPRRKNGSNG